MACWLETPWASQVIGRWPKCFSPSSPKKQDSVRSKTQTAQTSTVEQSFLVGVILS